MKNGIHINTAKISDLSEHFDYCDEEFFQMILNDRNINEYIEKIFTYSTLYEYWENNLLAGFAAIYENRGTEQPAYMTLLSVVQNMHGKGIASGIMRFALESLKTKGFTTLLLEVHKRNIAGRRLYEKFGFSIEREKTEDSFFMQLILQKNNAVITK